MARLVASTHAKRVRFPHPAPVLPSSIKAMRHAVNVSESGSIPEAAAISKPLHLGWSRTVDPVSDEFETRMHVWWADNAEKREPHTHADPESFGLDMNRVRPLFARYVERWGNTHGN